MNRAGDEEVRATGIAGMRFKGQASFFDAASIGRESLDAEEARNAHDPKAHNVLVASKEGERDAWGAAVRQVKIEFASLLSVGEECTGVFYNTTACVQRILMYLDRRMEMPVGTLLLTDAEYSGIIAAAHEYWRGGINVVALNHLLWRGESESAEDLLLRACLLGRPAVVYLSHVTRTTGHRLSDVTILRIRRMLPRSIIIIDGAQAVGNIVVESAILREVDFYVTSGHKWLGGYPSLGLLYSQEARMVADQAQGYSSRSGSAGTGSLGVLKSTARALRDFVAGPGDLGGTQKRMRLIAEHNVRMAQEFVGLVRERRWRLTPIGVEWHPESGIVTLVDRGCGLAVEDVKAARIEATRVLAEPYVGVEVIRGAGPRYWISERRTGGGELEVEPLDLESFSTNDPAGGGWRFSFHYFHESGHVASLVEGLDTLLTR